MGGVLGGWDRFWFRPVATSTLGVFRIAYGFVLTAWTLSLLPDATTFFSEDGVLPETSVDGWRWSFLALDDSRAAVLASMGLLLLAAICVMVGYRTRLATVISFLLLVSLRWRNIWVMNGGDSLLRHMGFFLMLSPAGAALSVDRWRTARDAFWTHPARAPWALRLIQIQISVVYLFTVWLKARGERWVAGTAVSDSLRVDDLVRFELPWFVTDSLLVANLLTYGTLAVELALAVLIWDRRLRPYVIALGVALHLFIELTMSLGFFSMAMIVGYVAFAPEDATGRLVEDVRARLLRSRWDVLRRLAATGVSGATARPTAREAPARAGVAG
jgi:hypothetical protein